MSRILSIDPGGKGGDTGIVLIEYDDTQPATLVDSWAVHDGFDGFCQWWFDYTSGNDLHVDYHIVETFVNYGRPGADLSPLLIEGVVRYTYPDVILSPASGKNTKMPDRAMTNLGFQRKAFGGDHHADRWEALRHALVWLKSQKHIPTLERAFPRV